MGNLSLRRGGTSGTRKDELRKSSGQRPQARRPDFQVRMRIPTRWLTGQYLPPSISPSI